SSSEEPSWASCSLSQQGTRNKDSARELDDTRICSSLSVTKALAWTNSSSNSEAGPVTPTRRTDSDLRPRSRIRARLRSKRTPIAHSVTRAPAAPSPIHSSTPEGERQNNGKG